MGAKIVAVRRAARAAALGAFLVIVHSGGGPVAAPDLVRRADNPQDAGCLSCHQGIESIGGKMDSFSCVLCHKGAGGAKEKEAAHRGMHSNPGDLRVAKRTCGMCHAEQYENLMKSLHATSAGVISGARYTWGAQEGRGSLYGNRAVADEDGVPEGRKGALKKLDGVPAFSESKRHVDDYLRKECLRCHVWTEGKKRPGDYRSSGCTACHMVYADDGLSRSGDPTIGKDEPGHPIHHILTNRIPSNQCLHCHNRGGRTGVSYIGTMEADPYGSPWAEGGKKQGKLHGKHYHRLQPDIHHEKGMDCVDCHTSREIHGDGNIYGKKEEAVEVRCRSCHGTVDGRTDLRTAWGNRLDNLAEVEGKVLLTAKLTGRKHSVTQLKDLRDGGKLPAAMAIPAHKRKLECYSCHSKWAPQCYGCHALRDDRKDGFDWIGEAETVGKWKETRSYLRWETPALGLNVKGRVSPFTTGCQVFFSHIDKDGRSAVVNKTFRTSHGHSGIAHNPVQPHTVTDDPRTCEDCHSSSKAQGLGTGVYSAEGSGLGIPFELERIVDEDGRQVQATSHDGARPFNKAELEKISRVNVCISCHEKMSDPEAWKKVTDVVGFVRTNEEHKKLLKGLLP